MELFQGATIIKMFDHLVPAPLERTKWCIQKNGVVHYINHTPDEVAGYQEVTKEDFENAEIETAWTIEEMKKWDSKPIAPNESECEPRREEDGNNKVV